MDGDEKIPLIKKEKRSKKTRKYYEDQEALQRQWIEDDLIIAGESVEEDETPGDIRLSKLIFASNICLLIAKSVATYLSSGTSLAIISTLLDSVVDITSSIGIWYASYAIAHADKFMYPRGEFIGGEKGLKFISGRENLELIAFIFIGVIMGMANVYIMFQSVARIISFEIAPDITTTALAILLGTILTKGVLLFACYRQKTPAAKVLAIDQRNDVLTNIVGMGGAILSKFWTPYADPVAACLIAGYITLSWAGVVLEQMPILSGKQCTPVEFSRVVHVLINHSDRVKMVETLLIYHTGLKVRIEAHVVLDPETPSHIVHDEIEEPLKRKLERLPFVDRAFVHPDYECDGYEP